MLKILIAGSGCKHANEIFTHLFQNHNALEIHLPNTAPTSLNKAVIDFAETHNHPVYITNVDNTDADHSYQAVLCLTSKRANPTVKTSVKKAIQFAKANNAQLRNYDVNRKCYVKCT